MSICKLHQLLALGAFAAGVLFTSSSPAESAAEVRQLAVHYGDLDLQQSGDVNVLYARIKQAAATVCDSFDSRALAHQAQRRGCVSKAVARAVADVSAPALSDLHSHRRELRLASAH